MTIELDGITDVNAIKGLYETLFEDMSKLQPDFFRAAGQDGDFIKSVIESGSDDIFLAKENQQVLGFALVQQKSTPPFHALFPFNTRISWTLSSPPIREAGALGGSSFKR